MTLRSDVAGILSDLNTLSGDLVYKYTTSWVLLTTPYWLHENVGGSFAWDEQKGAYTHTRTGILRTVITANNLLKIGDKVSIDQVLVWYIKGYSVNKGQYIYQLSLVEPSNNSVNGSITDRGLA
jgi:hypothetical protein